MISQKSIKSEYNNLYSYFRNYIWGFPAVECLADLELAVYQACPNIPDVRLKLNRLRMMASEVCRYDEDLDKAFKSFSDVVDSENEAYYKLVKVNEVVSDED